MNYWLHSELCSAVDAVDGQSSVGNTVTVNKSYNLVQHSNIIWSLLWIITVYNMPKNS